MPKTNKEIETVENDSPMGDIASLPKIQTIVEAPKPQGHVQIRQKIAPIFITNYLNRDIGLWWDSKEYIYKARTKAPVQIGGVLENQNVRMKWAKDLAVEAYYDEHPSAMGKDAKSRYPRDAELTPYVQRALEEAPVSEAELGEEKDLDMKKDYHVMKSTNEFAALSGQA